MTVYGIIDAAVKSGIDKRALTERLRSYCGGTRSRTTGLSLLGIIQCLREDCGGDISALKAEIRSAVMEEHYCRNRQ